MHRTYDEAKHEMPDVAAFVRKLKTSRDLFANNSGIYITRAPGRLDVMGGIADYSGSLVLEMPIAEAALVALQKQDSRVLNIVSLGELGTGRTNSFEMPLLDFEKDGAVISYGAAQAYFKRDAASSWAAYIAGAFLVLMCEKGVRFRQGARILIDSKVPEGKGVSSSAAIEVAAMSAISAAFDLEIGGRELALLCQKVENLVVGAPCGIMDQMTSACGEADNFLSMKCQPAELLDAIKLPPELSVWGIDSGIRHSVGGVGYGAVRTGAFIGYRIIAELAGLKARPSDVGGVVNVEDDRWKGYLANITPAEFEREFAMHLPREISGEEFLERYRGITDTVTQVLPDRTYPVLFPTTHPIYENRRLHDFADLLNERMTEESLGKLGQFMYDSHASYSACGLGSGGTDLLVELARRSKDLYGARITGGGSGGTVAILGLRDAGPEIRKIAEDYEKQTNYRPLIFSGSSMGAAAFGHMKLGL